MWNAHLFPGILHHNSGHLVCALREATCELEEFEEEGKTKPRRASLIAQEGPLVWLDRPMENQFIRRPVAFQRRILPLGRCHYSISQKYQKTK